MSVIQCCDKQTDVTAAGGTERSSPFGRFASEYDAWFGGEGRLTFAIELRAFQEILPHLPKPWLEIGVGSGRLAQSLGIETGVDPCVKLVEMARRRGVSTLLARGEELPFQEASFGTVFLMVSMCFLERPGMALREAKRVLVPDGKIVLGLVLRDSPWGRFYRQRGKPGHRLYEHARFYGYEQLVSLLVTAGLPFERVVSTLFQRPGAVQRMEEPREGYLPGAGLTIVVATRPGTHAPAGRDTHFGAQLQD